MRTLRRHLMSECQSFWGIGALVAAVASVGLAVARTSFFFADDFTFGVLWTQHPLSSELLLRSYFGHLMPAVVVLDSTFYRTVSMNWPCASAVMVATLVGLTVAVVRLVDAVVGRRRIGLVAGAMAGLSLGILPLVTWWIAALNNMLPLAAGIGFLGCVTRWARSGRARHLIAAGLMYALSVSLYEKSLVFSVYAVLLTILVVDAGLPVRDRLRLVRSRWPLWMLIGVLSSVVVVVYLSGGYRAEAGPRPLVGVMAEFGTRAVLLGLVPAIFGFNLQLPIYAGVVTPVAVVAGMGLAGYVTWTIVRSRTNIGIWLFGVLAVLIGEVPLAFGRAGLLGVDGGRSLRYQIEGCAFMAITACVAMSVAVSAPARLRVPSKPGASRRAWRGVVLVGLSGAGLLGCVLAWSASVVQMARATPGAASRPWVEDLRRTWADVGPVKLVDGPMPGSFLFDWQYPYNLASQALPQLVDGATFTTETVGSWFIDREGRLGHFVFTPTERVVMDTCSPAGQPVEAPVIGADEKTVYLVVKYHAGGPGQSQVLGGVGSALVDTSGLRTVYPTRSGDGEFVALWWAGALDHLSISSTAPGFCVQAVERGEVSAE